MKKRALFSAILILSSNLFSGCRETVDCEAKYPSVDEARENARHCEQTSDCEIVDPGCNCIFSTSINSSESDNYFKVVDDYCEFCSSQTAARCPFPNWGCNLDKMKPVCTAKKCSMACEDAGQAEDAHSAG